MTAAQLTLSSMSRLHAAAVLALASLASAQDPQWDQGYRVYYPPGILPHRERAAAVNRMLRDRLDNLLPRLMRETGLDTWVVINREYAEDPVYLTLVPEPVFAARRTTILVFHDRGGDQGVERLTVSRYGLADLYQTAWDGGSDDEQWQRLAEILRERQPEKIGVNTSAHWAFGDGLSSGLRARLEVALDDDLRGRLVSAEELCIRWLETRSALEMEIYPQLVQIARGVITEAFSNDVITPGVTTTDDVAWWIRQRFSDLGLKIWFQPYVNVQRRGLIPDAAAPIIGTSGVVIERGDVLHTDVGIDYLRLHTDTQEMGYVLHTGEEQVPEGLRIALAIGNRWQDHLTSSFVTGRTGNEILAATLEKCASGGHPQPRLHPPGRLPRPRRRSHHRHVGQPGPDAGARRLAALRRHLLRDRRQRRGQGRRVGRPKRADQARAGRLVRRREGVVHRRAPNGVARGAVGFHPRT